MAIIRIKESLRCISRHNNDNNNNNNNNNILASVCAMASLSIAWQVIPAIYSFSFQTLTIMEIVYRIKIVEEQGNDIYNLLPDPTPNLSMGSMFYAAAAAAAAAVAASNLVALATLPSCLFELIY
uniref:Uncharacterized protein n=1 Tax=Glossina pallidipes TaxID=7398 RepID=A0A1B0ADH7_GLOPL